MVPLRDEEDGMSPTRGIYWILKPYWASGQLDDQHWAYVISCLRRIETRCWECQQDEVVRRI